MKKILIVLLLALAATAMGQNELISASESKTIVSPSCPWGTDSLYAFLESQIRYPKQAINNNVEGKVIVEFVVEVDGTLTHICCTKDIGYGCGAEVERVLGLLPPWNPCTVDGVPVRVKAVLPFNFKFSLHHPFVGWMRKLFGK